ncbi:MAG: hypothetical protein LBJ35_00630 [Spirochaetaceae bacterium]|jgi:hypothetical protein|nr:hypothetical protein [Spirochaetaceae bacterium]
MRKQKKLQIFEMPPAAKFCHACKSSDGIPKEIYETAETARRRAEHIKKERGIALKAYSCPSGCGWHLTKDMEAGEDDYIPRAPVCAGKVPWEYDSGGRDSVESAAQKGAAGVRRKVEYKKPIVKVEGKTGKSVTLRGRVSELIKNIDIEKLFGVSLDNPFSAYSVKDFAGGEHCQITVFTEDGANQIKSWTALVKKTDVTKGDSVTVTLTGKKINGKKVWHCVAITKETGNGPASSKAER